MKESLGPEVNLSGFFMVGLPEETVDSVYATAEWLGSADCALDSWHFAPYGVGPGSDKRIASDPAKYGYELRDGGNWRSKWMDFETAVRVSEDVTARTMHRSKIPGYSAIRLASLLGPEEAAKWTKADVFARRDEIAAKTEAAKQDYLSRLLA